MAELLEIDRLSLAFGTREGRLNALREVSFNVRRGRIVGLVGESGSGKSTIGMAILGLLSANAKVLAGAVRFEGRDLLRLSAEELRALRGQRITVVFQDPMTSLNPVVTIGQMMLDIQFRDTRSRRAQKRARAIAMLERVGIPDAATRFDHYPHQFSGGMRQRIAIAMALLASPALLIADEPTTALDVTTEAQILDLLRDLRREFDGSILFISHQLGVIAELCDEVVVLYAGEVVEQAPVEALFARPAHPYTQALLECEPARGAGGEFTTIPGKLPDLRDPPPGCAFAARCTHATKRCHIERPLPMTVGPGHVARCHYAGDV
jgi:peptide/nickel transport system ATP-binding protein